MVTFTKEQEAYIDHEVRIRTTEGTFKRLEDKIDSHFKWMLATMLLLIITVITFMVTVTM